MDRLIIETANGPLVIWSGRGFCGRYYTLLDRLGEARIRTDLPADQHKLLVDDRRENVTIHVDVCDECQSYWKDLMKTILESGNGHSALEDLPEPG